MEWYALVHPDVRLYSVSGVALVSGSSRDAVNFAFPDPAFDG